MQNLRKATKSFSFLLFVAAMTLLLGACAGFGGPDTPPPTTSKSPPPDYGQDDTQDPEPAPTYDRSASLHDKVHAALERAPSLQNTNISVRVEGSVVYLSGEVDTPEQKQTAHDVAHSVEGVTNVHYDDIRVD